MTIYDDELFLEHAKIFMNQIQNGMVILKVLGQGNYQTVFQNELLVEKLGYDTSDIPELLKKDPLEFVFESDREKIRLDLERSEEDSILVDTYRLKTKAGKVRWVRASHQRRFISKSECIVITFTSVHDLIGAQEEIESDRLKWADIVNSIPVGLAIFCETKGETSIVAVNDTLVTFSNRVGQLLDGNSREWSKGELEMLLNQNIYAFCIEEDQHLVAKMITDSVTNPISSCVFRLRGSTEKKTVYIYSCCCSKMIGDDVRNYYYSFQDVTVEQLQKQELKDNQKLLWKLSYFDTLSGVKNRNAFKEHIAWFKKNRQENVGIAFADVNGLKKTNDLLGHLYGDQMIVKLAEILKSEFTEEEIFRISGDEFVIACIDISRTEFQKKMSNVIKEAEKNNNIASIGYIWKETVSDLKRRVNQAEQIMYVEKQRYYELEKSSNSKHHPLLLSNLLTGLEKKEYVMYLQPKAEISGNHIIGAEALVRKIDKDGNIIPPYEFIPQLEKERLVPKIDYFMFEEVCKFLASETDYLSEDFVISVNMSRVTLAENEFMDTISYICNQYDFDRKRLEIEITESNETMDNARMEDYIKRIRELGISISLDDVGADYSSFPMLIMDGIDTVKLDRSLIIQIGKNKASKLLSHMIDMCHDLGMKVIAEGVEEDVDRDALAAMNCDMFQGYLLSRPIPANEFKELFLRRK